MSVKSSSKNRCLYCNQSGHTINNCKKDIALFSHIDLNKFKYRTAFTSLDKKYLQRLAVQPTFLNMPQIDEDNNLSGRYMSISLKLPKKELIDILHKRTVEMLKVLARHKELTEKKDCPICYEKMGNHTCTTTCGHEMCTGCFSKVFLHARATSGPSCPMCRASLVPSDFRRESTSGPSVEERERERQQWRELQTMERIRNHRTSGNILGLR